MGTLIKSPSLPSGLECGLFVGCSFKLLAVGSGKCTGYACMSRAPLFQHYLLLHWKGWLLALNGVPKRNFHWPTSLLPSFL